MPKRARDCSLIVKNIVTVDSGKHGRNRLIHYSASVCLYIGCGVRANP